MLAESGATFWVGADLIGASCGREVDGAGVGCDAIGTFVNDGADVLDGVGVVDSTGVLAMVDDESEG